MVSHAIRTIDGFVLSCALPERVGNARTSFDRRSALLIRVTTDSGHAGWGECWSTPEAAAALIRAELGPALKGADASLPLASIAPLLGFAAQDKRGLHHMAMSALDIAVWDCFGQITGRPLCDLLGGARREAIPAYASGPLLKPADPYGGIEEALGQYLQMGFRAFKLRIGMDRHADADALRRARAIIGPDALLMADLNEASSAKEAMALARLVEDLDLGWLEEPLPHDNFPAYARLTPALPVPVAGGESLYGVGAFREVLVDGGLDVIQPDLALCGGITEARKIAALAEAFGVPLVPHVWGTGINYLAALQFSATLQPTRIGCWHYPLHEVDVGHNPLRAAMVDIELDGNGAARVPRGPGLGLPIEPGRFEQFIVDRWSIG